MNPALLAILINNFAVPELDAWLRSRHAAGAPITDADVLQKLLTDTTFGATLFDTWLTAHPLLAPGPVAVPAAPGVVGT